MCLVWFVKNKRSDRYGRYLVHNWYLFFYMRAKVFVRCFSTYLYGVIRKQFTRYLSNRHGGFASRIPPKQNPQDLAGFSSIHELCTGFKFFTTSCLRTTAKLWLNYNTSTTTRFYPYSSDANSRKSRRCTGAASDFATLSNCLSCARNAWICWWPASGMAKRRWVKGTHYT